MITGTQVVLCDGEQLIDIVRNGQGVLNVLPLAGVKGEVDASIRRVPDRPRRRGRGRRDRPARHAVNS